MKTDKLLWPMRFSSRHLCVWCPPSSNGRTMTMPQNPTSCRWSCYPAISRRHLTTASMVAPPGTRDKVSTYFRERNPLRTVYGPTHFPGGWIGQLAPSNILPSGTVDHLHRIMRNDSYSKPEKIYNCCSNGSGGRAAAVSFLIRKSPPSSRKWDDHGLMGCEALAGAQIASERVGH